MGGGQQLEDRRGRVLEPRLAPMCTGACATGCAWDVGLRQSRLGQMALGALHVLATKICPKLLLAVARLGACPVSATCCARIWN